MALPLNEKPSPADLTQQFGIPGKVEFSLGAGNLTMVSLRHGLSDCAISLYGAQVLSCHLNQQEVLWLSPLNDYAPGRAIRGGVPLCWPWFGPYVKHPDLPASDRPAHGFARIRNWTMLGSGLFANGCYVDLGLALSEPGLESYHARLRVSLDKALHLDLETHNSGSQPIPLSMALHTYFKVGDIHEIGIEGLSDCEYLDKVDQGKRKRQSGQVRFQAETDSVYLNTEGRCTIHDPSLQRQIHIDKQGSLTTVVWNPWQEKVTTMKDFPAADYQHTVCVEAANAAENSIQLAPGDSHHMICHIACSK